MLYNKYNVLYNLKNTDKTSGHYNVLVKEIRCFPTFGKAMRFAKAISNRSSNKYKIVGTPIVERTYNV